MVVEKRPREQMMLRDLDVTRQALHTENQEAEQLRSCLSTIEMALTTADREAEQLKPQRLKRKHSSLVRHCHYRIFLFCVAPHLINWYGFLVLALSAVMEQLNAASVLPWGQTSLSASVLCRCRSRR